MERVTSPRTCYSIEADREEGKEASSIQVEEEANPNTTESNDFLLVLQSDEKDKPIKDDQLKTIVDHWATSGDEANGKTSPKRSRKDKNVSQTKKESNLSKPPSSAYSSSPSTSASSLGSSWAQLF